MKTIRLDLHIHSQHSHDGRMTLEEITQTAEQRGLDVVAVCDHDVVYTGDTSCHGVLVIPGVEFSTEYGHLLGLFLKEPLTYTTWEETLQRIHAQGGLAVLAHPFQHSREETRLLPLVPYLDGIEVWNGRANRKNPSANAMARDFAVRHGLTFFAGSDAHLKQEIGNGVVTLTVSAVTLSAVYEALKNGERTIEGKEGGARWVARSQYTKLRSKKASPVQYAKWALFALRCVGKDLGNLFKGGKRLCH